MQKSTSFAHLRVIYQNPKAQPTLSSASQSNFGGLKPGSLLVSLADQLQHLAKVRPNVFAAIQILVAREAARVDDNGPPKEEPGGIPWGWRSKIECVIVTGLAGLNYLVY